MLQSFGEKYLQRSEEANLRHSALPKSEGPALKKAFDDEFEASQTIITQYFDILNYFNIFKCEEYYRLRTTLEGSMSMHQDHDYRTSWSCTNDSCLLLIRRIH
jgi:hypothetical protein